MEPVPAGPAHQAVSKLSDAQGSLLSTYNHFLLGIPCPLHLVLLDSTPTDSLKLVLLHFEMSEELRSSWGHCRLWTWLCCIRGGSSPVLRIVWGQTGPPSPWSVQL